MPSIADSSAILDSERVLAQHQVALTLIKAQTEDPQRPALRWLDLACGRGQILQHVTDLLSPMGRAKVHYRGVDSNQDYCRETESFGKGIFSTCEVYLSEIEQFEAQLKKGETFDAVTITNAIHEIAPNQLVKLLPRALGRVARSGFLFAYDMEQPPDLELGAVSWHAKEIEDIVQGLLLSVGETRFLPSVSTISHKTCKAWQLHVDRSHISDKITYEDFTGPSAIKAVREIVSKKLENKLEDLTAALGSSKKYDKGISLSRESIIRMTYDYYAVCDAIDCLRGEQQ
jgi:SAM-dependent methyltransferase